MNFGILFHPGIKPLLAWVSECHSGARPNPAQGKVAFTAE
ncbi:hypothetical protein BN129_397 [Cronobacter sakazakii 701]|nr:hypothetical protein BN129_397 [Cronobacter sakazakii 701]